jgi:hypothetical protein
VFDPFRRGSNRRYIFTPTPKEIIANKMLRKAFTPKANNMIQATRMRQEQHEQACWLSEL